MSFYPFALVTMKSNLSAGALFWAGAYTGANKEEVIERIKVDLASRAEQGLLEHRFSKPIPDEDLDLGHYKDLPFPTEVIWVVFNG